jgi:2',3'-cyclic-nucleotide 2'-phosphodiesterase (5'-nucleotidase family)
MKTHISLLIISVTALCNPLLYGQTAQIREVTVLYTNDEHGWMEGMSPGQGAANLYQLWRDQEGYSKDGDFLVLSGGDNFTGPAISTWVQGESMVAIMNAMDYDASAVGNHEFDFGLQALRQRADEAHYPYLGANIRWRESGRPVTDLGILPWTLREVNGVAVAIIGLTTTSTPYVTNPEHVRELEFSGYEAAVRQTMVDINDSNPDLVFIISHVCMDELEPLVRSLQDLEIAMAGGGHCNELAAREIGKTVVLGGGFHFTSYARATFRYDIQARQLVSTSYLTRRNRGADADAGIAAIVSQWADSASDTLKEVVAWSAAPIARGEGLEQLIVDAWLAVYPAADIAITNLGGVRADLPAGAITLSDLVNSLPFENTIVSIDISGREVSRALGENRRIVVAGLEKRGSGWVLTATGNPLDMARTYSVLLNSFMYAGGDNFGFMADADPDGFDTGMHYRQPFYDWLKSRNTSRANPLRN